MPVATKKKEELQYKLFPETDEYGGFIPPEPLDEIMSQIEYLMENQQIDDDEYDGGVYYAVNELLSCPAAMIVEKAKELLLDILDRNLELTEDEEVIEERKMLNAKPANDVEAAATVNRDATPPVTVIRDTNPEPLDNDISDEELLLQLGARPEVLHED